MSFFNTNIIRVFSILRCIMTLQADYNIQYFLNPVEFKAFFFFLSI